MNNKVDVTDLEDNALIELCSSKLIMRAVAGCGFNSLKLLKEEFIFTGKQFVTFQSWLRS